MNTDLGTESATHLIHALIQMVVIKIQFIMALSCANKLTMLENAVILVIVVD